MSLISDKIIGFAVFKINLSLNSFGNYGNYGNF